MGDKTNGELETAFARLVGGQPSQDQVERLYRIRDALGVREDDALWSIIVALEHYDSFFRAYPAELAEVTSQSIESARAAFKAAAEREAAMVQRALAEKVAETSVVLARRLADKPLGVHRFTLALSAVVAFGSLCVHAGYELATGARPFWIAPTRDLRGARGLLSMVLSVPAGWMIFALLLPGAAYGAKVGWNLGADAVAPLERAAGWAIVLLCVVGAIACAVMIAHVTS